MRTPRNAAQVRKENKAGFSFVRMCEETQKLVNTENVEAEPREPVISLIKPHSLIQNPHNRIFKSMCVQDPFFLIRLHFIFLFKYWGHYCNLQISDPVSTNQVFAILLCTIMCRWHKPCLQRVKSEIKALQQERAKGRKSLKHHKKNSLMSPI